jgi:hypothetical protein
VNGDVSSVSETPPHSITQNFCYSYRMKKLTLTILSLLLCLTSDIGWNAKIENKWTVEIMPLNATKFIETHLVPN